MTGGAGEKARAARLPGLESRLFDIPEDKFIEVVRLLERVRDHPDVRQTFAAIRPRLVQVRPERRPTLKRVLCMPFEDVLESFGGVDVPLGRIERRVIDPVWKLVMECGDTALIDQLDRQVQETAPGNLNALRNIGRRLWPMAAQAIRVLARAQQDAVWARQQIGNQIRDLLKDFYPGALAAFAELPDGVRVSTEFPELTRRYFDQIGVKATIVPSYGATEAKVPDIVDAIVDLTETGTSLKKHGLKIIDTLLTSRTELITNATAYADDEKRAAMEDILLLLRGAIQAR